MVKPSETRIVMAKRLARKWLASVARPEFRLQVLCGSKDFKNLPNFLRSFRDGKVVVGNVSPIPDLGVLEGFDSLSVWSSDREALISLKDWFEKRDIETSGVW